MVNLEEKSHYEVDKDKQEIRLTLPTQLELEKLVDINDASVKASPKLAPKVKKVWFSEILRPKSSENLFFVQSQQKKFSFSVKNGFNFIIIENGFQIQRKNGFHLNLIKMV